MWPASKDGNVSTNGRCAYAISDGFANDRSAFLHSRNGIYQDCLETTLFTNINVYSYLEIILK